MTSHSYSSAQRRSVLGDDLFVVRHDRFQGHDELSRRQAVFDGRTGQIFPLARAAPVADRQHADPNQLSHMKSPLFPPVFETRWTPSITMRLSTAFAMS